MERTIIMTQGASKVTSTHKNLIKGANRFFQSTAKNCPDNIRIHDIVKIVRQCKYPFDRVWVWADKQGQTNLSNVFLGYFPQYAT